MLLTINIGRIPKTISGEKSVKKLIRPKAITLRNPTGLRGSLALLSLFFVYEPKGKLTIFDILEDYRGYQKFDEVWQAYKELETEGSLPKE